MEEVKVILQDAIAEIEEKRSKFIAHIFYIESVQEAENRIKEIRKKYFDAKHHCYAYRVLEQDGIREKQSDDGEPSGTAGAPMLNILQKNGILKVLIVVTRYFGGTLLGTGGLIRAYSDVTITAMKKARIGLQILGYEMKIVLEYKEWDKFHYYCRKNQIRIIDTIYDKEIICKIELSNKDKEKLIQNHQEEIRIQEYHILGEKYIKVDNLLL